MKRYITFTFDDGLIKTAKIVEKINIPATFYIVLGWVLKEVEINDSFNLNLDHGNIKEWIDLKLDIGCHTYNHSKIIDEYYSYNKFSNFFKNKPKNLATPYGINYKPKFYDSCKIGFYEKPYNFFKNSKQINSINPNYDFKDKEYLKEVIEKCPENGWIVFTFHGIEEGWNPIKSKDLEFWIKFFNKKNFTFCSITEGVKKCTKFLL